MIKIVATLCVVILIIFCIKSFGDEAGASPKVNKIPCYVCREGEPVKYEGKDSFLLRQQAWKKYKCNVKSRIWECTTDRVVKQKSWAYYQKEL